MKQPFFFTIRLFLLTTVWLTTSVHGAELIAFTRLVKLKPIPLFEIFTMKPDGSNIKNFTNLTTTGEFCTANHPQWIGDGTKLLFSSNYKMWRSAFYRDIFVINADGTGLKRLTGWEKGPFNYSPPKGIQELLKEIYQTQNAFVSENLEAYQNESYHRVLLSPMTNLFQHLAESNPIPFTHLKTDQSGRLNTISNNKRFGKLMVLVDANRVRFVSGTQAKFAYQGHDRLLGVGSPGVETRQLETYGVVVIIHNVKPGRVWVKTFASKYLGGFTSVTVRPGRMARAKFILRKTTNVSCEYPSAGPRLKQISFNLVRSGSTRTIDPNTNKPQIKQVDIHRMAWWPLDRQIPLARSDPLPQVSTHARFSPDGKRVAFSVGELTQQSLAVMPVTGNIQEQAKILAPGGMQLLVGYYSNLIPAWSPDGRMLAYINQWLLAEGNVSGNIYTVPSDGSAQPVQVTRVQKNQMAWYPTFSPDGKTIAFTLVTSKGPSLTIIDLLNFNYKMDIYTIGVDGSNLRQITHDGVSCEPTWNHRVAYGSTPSERPQEELLDILKRSKIQ